MLLFALFSLKQLVIMSSDKPYRCQIPKAGAFATVERICISQFLYAYEFHNMLIRKTNKESHAVSMK